MGQKLIPAWIKISKLRFSAVFLKILLTWKNVPLKYSENKAANKKKIIFEYKVEIKNFIKKHFSG